MEEQFTPTRRLEAQGDPDDPSIRQQGDFDRSCGRHRLTGATASYVLACRQRDLSPQTIDIYRAELGDMGLPVTVSCLLATVGVDAEPFQLVLPVPVIPEATPSVQRMH